METEQWDLTAGGCPSSLHHVNASCIVDTNDALTVELT